MTSQSRSRSEYLLPTDNIIEFVVVVIIIIIYFLTMEKREKPLAQKITKGNHEICIVMNLLWSVVISETIVQQNRIKSLHHNGNPLE